MPRKLTQGNEAVFRGAIAAGANYYAGYPISPSTEILNIASGWAAEHPEFRFLQAEDEIASANAIIGASLAGAKSFTATSGPGFSLMQEAVGYAQKVGVACVFVNVQRVGPATGMPTMPGQGDIMQVRYGSTGDYTPHRLLSQRGGGGVPGNGAGLQCCRGVAQPGRHPVGHVRRPPQRGGGPGRDGGRASTSAERETAPLGRHEPGNPRFFAGVLMYEHGPNAGEPATADADEYLRQYYDGQAAPPGGGRALCAVRAHLERRRARAADRLRDRQPCRGAAGAGLRAVPPDPHPPDAGRRAAVHRRPL